jgi:hypothetical protein
MFLDILLGIVGDGVTAQLRSYSRTADGNSSCRWDCGVRAAFGERHRASAVNRAWMGRERQLEGMAPATDARSTALNCP